MIKPYIRHSRFSILGLVWDQESGVID